MIGRTLFISLLPCHRSTGREATLQPSAVRPAGLFTRDRRTPVKPHHNEVRNVTYPSSAWTGSAAGPITGYLIQLLKGDWYSGCETLHLRQAPGTLEMSEYKGYHASSLLCLGPCLIGCECGSCLHCVCVPVARPDACPPLPPPSPPPPQPFSLHLWGLFRVIM